MTPVELGFALTLGLMSGLHCMQMCGPIALAVGPGRAAILYNTGRILTYTFLGMLAGGVGKALMWAGGPATIIAGAAMLVAGVALLLPSKSLITIKPRGRFARLSGGLLRAGRNKFLLGLVLGFLPCGLVYAALLKAMHAAGPLAGALTMFCYGLGTAVALLGIAYAGAFRGRWLQRLAPFGIMLAGAVMVWRGLSATPHCHG